MKIRKKKKMWLNYRAITKPLHSKENHKQNEKTTFVMEENICKRSNQWGINLQNMQTDQAAQIKQTNNPI